jgi:nucleoside-diphosphate-sugar epimerase
MAKFLVTGGAGFIGSHLVENLIRQNQQVVALDNLSSGRYANIAPFMDKSGRLTFIEGDVRDLQTCRQAMAGVDYVLHQAARPSVQRSMEDPLLSHDINVTGGLNVLMAAAAAKVKRLVAASSSSVYGNRQPESEPKREDMDMRPLSPYAVNKVSMEYYCRVFCQRFALSTVSLRYFNVFGPRQDPDSPYAAVIPKFIFSLLHDQRPVIYGDGAQARDFTYVDNVVAANLSAAVAPGVDGMAFNVAGGQSFSLLDLLARLQRILKRPDIEPIFAPSRPGDVRYSAADLRLSRRLLNYQTLVNFEQGLQKVAALALGGRYMGS